ncbi:hypothetical protein BKA63DRAFT_607246 [Paraphoma chrysanthemicola]|nr:hypothetical protein BKA63DRAFT_607246 [Paraphoma chrysanthemicola]
MSAPANPQPFVSSSKNTFMFDYLDPLVLTIYIGLYLSVNMLSITQSCDYNLAFLIRYSTYSLIGAESVSVIGTRTTQGLEVVAVMLHNGSDDAHIIASAAANGEEGSVLRYLLDEVNRLTFQVVEKVEKMANP